MTAVLFVTFLDTTIVSVTLADIQEQLHAGVASLQWVINAYTLTFAALMLSGGSLGDRFGRKKVMVAGLVVFCAGSVVAALAQNVTALVVGRAVMGVGAAGSEPGTLSVLRHLYPDRAARAKALGLWAAVSGLALALGPVLGGLLLDSFGWRSVFWFNLAFGVVVLAATALFVPDSSDPQPGRFDWTGFVLGAVGLATIIYAVIAGERTGYRTAEMVTLFVIGGLALAGFVLMELRVRNPLIQFAYLGKPSVRSALLVAFAVYFGVFSIFFFTALYLQVVMGYSGMRTSALFTPMAIAIIGGSLLSGLWVARQGARIPMLVGCVLAAAGLLVTRELLSGTIEFGSLSAAMALAGLGFGVAIVPLTSAVLSGVPAAHSGMAAAATNTMRQVGAVVGVAALGSVVNSYLTGDLAAKLNRDPFYRSMTSMVVDAVQTGSAPNGGTIRGPHSAPVMKLLKLAFASFEHGVSMALLVSAVLILIAAALAAIATRGERATAGFDAD
ncbi:MFS transporter [Nocardia stercoris]|uniref:MFS transporter n=1 Tax=Nocardia stercoris TaxID=2483361 RepID=A0A3M2LI98_9NOCA|nr:MFS transporter [Nocardia stercoris]